MAVLLLVVTALVYIVALQAQKAEPYSHQYVVFGVSGLVLYLATFKVLQALEGQQNLVIPLGLSYYVFKLISYLLDVHWKKISAERNFISFAAFVAFFPQIVAGPIQRADSLIPQLKKPANSGVDVTVRGIVRVLTGFFKKMIIADNLALFVNQYFSGPAGHGSIANVIAFYLFPLQIYADFSGLTDIAIGAALIFEIESPENFDRPFSAASIGELWRRWHMSLTEWARIYIFTPLMAATRNYGDFGLAISITVNMLIIGIWHGFSVTFVVFGLVNAVYLMFDALSSRSRKRMYKTYPRLASFSAFVGPILTYHLFALSALFFRAPSLASAVQAIAGLFRPVGDIRRFFESILAPPHSFAWIAFPALVFAVVADVLNRRLSVLSTASLPRPARWSIYAATTVTSIFLIFVLLTRRSQPNPFFYAMF